MCGYVCQYCCTGADACSVVVFYWWCGVVVLIVWCGCVDAGGVVLVLVGWGGCTGGVAWFCWWWRCVLLCPVVVLWWSWWCGLVVLVAVAVWPTSGQCHASDCDHYCVADTDNGGRPGPRAGRVTITHVH